MKRVSEYLKKQCKSATSQTPVHSIQSLVSQSPDALYGSFRQPFKTTISGIYNGDRADEGEGSDTKYAFGFLPRSDASIRPESGFWTVLKFQQDINAGDESDKAAVKASFETAVKLIRNLELRIKRDSKADSRLYLAFSRDGIHTEIGRPTNNDAISWATTMTRTNDVPKLLELKRKNNETMSFDRSGHARILANYHDRKKMLIDKVCGAPPGQSDMFDMEGTMQSPEADPAGPRSLDSVLKLRYASFQGAPAPTVKDVTAGQGDRYVFEFVPPTSTNDGLDYTLDQFNGRDTSKQTEHRFHEALNPALGSLAILSEDECSDVVVRYETSNDFSVNIENRTVQEEEGRSCQSFLVTLDDHDRNRPVPRRQRFKKT